MVSPLSLVEWGRCSRRFTTHTLGESECLEGFSKSVKCEDFKVCRGASGETLNSTHFLRDSSHTRYCFNGISEWLSSGVQTVPNKSPTTRTTVFTVGVRSRRNLRLNTHHTLRRHQQPRIRTTQRSSRRRGPTRFSSLSYLSALSPAQCGG